MRCPFCAEDKDKVIDSRATEGGRVVRRRRQCLACNKRFTTYEHIERNTRLMVIKNDGTRVPYDREKMLSGLQKACYKREVPMADLERVVDEVEEELFRKYEKELLAVEIGKALADRLKHLDQVAYVRFASVYYQFGSVNDLLDEIRDLLDLESLESPDQGKLFES
jgi:transcriptional repressor NrdR